MVIKHVYGNVLNFEIPLTVKIVTLEDGETSEREEPFYPDTTQPVKVKLTNQYSTGLTYDAEVTGNVLHIEDRGLIRQGKYGVTVTCTGQDGNPYRYMCKDAIEVVNATADAGIEAGVEFDVETYILEGAVFIDYTSGEQVQADWNERNPDSKAYIRNKPDLSDFATQGDLAEVEGKIPTLPEHIVTDEDYVHTDNNYSDEDKAKVGDALTQETDPTVPNWAKQPSKPTYTAREVGALPSDTPLFSGSYNDLTDKPTIPDAQIQSDWNQTNTGAKDFIKNKPAIPTVPTNVSAFVNDAGYVNDISMKVDKEQGKGLSSNDYTTEEKTKLAGLENYDDTAVRGLIAGKQDIINDLATIRSGAGLGATAYQKPSTGIPASDIADGVIPTVPTNVSAFTNDAGYLTAHQDISGKEDKMPIDARNTSVSALTAEVNKYYRLDIPVETLAITLPTVTDATSVKSIVFYMTGGTTPSITFTSTHNVYYSNGFGIESGKTYEVNALYNGIAWVVASVEIVTSNS